MSEIHPEAQERIDFLDTYEESEALETFNILHLYPEEPAYPNGYIDARFFRLVGFHEARKEKRDMGSKDGLAFYREPVPQLDIIRIFADGSTLVKFKGYVKVGWGQASVVTAVSQ